MKKAIIYVLLISILVSLSGCAYNKHDNSVKSINHKLSSMSPSLNLSTTSSITSLNDYSKNTDRESELSQTQLENTKNATDTALKAFKSILQNKSEFYNTDAQKNQYLKEFLANNGAFDCILKILHFTVLDMDGDKIPEVIIKLAINGHDYEDFYEVLHYIDDKVYGYIFSNRCLGGVKADGTFIYSGGASDNGFGKLKFQGSTCVTESIGYKESEGSKDDNTPNEIYFIDNKQVTSDKYESFVTEQFAKKEAIWFDISPKSIEKELSTDTYLHETNQTNTQREYTSNSIDAKDSNVDSNKDENKAFDLVIKKFNLSYNKTSDDYSPKGELYNVVLIGNGFDEKGRYEVRICPSDYPLSIYTYCYVDLKMGTITTKP